MTISNSDGTHGAAGGEQPRPQRKNLMLAATIECDGTRAQVRIRNLSETGAMLDGATLPNSGAALTLVRAEITVGATVVWREGGRCGIHFDSVAATVDEWITGRRPPSFHGKLGQARVDAIQSEVRAGAALPAEAAPPPAGALSAKALEQRVAEEVIHVQRLIDALGEELVEDPAMLQRHLRVLQNLDRASQILEHLGNVLGAPDRVAAAQGIAMQDLRERLLRKPNF
ncbi:PilZ domain-containing protein [Sphingomonas psychrotolerans]|uniref:PilZ domain-containing protein n=1 Tax=Sphingomonas psychrotolerans TaxID=1327635 RepID=A0A2K8MDJ8_9SPHN|nr:PilZ domain-containing protein [Sphingomonas psychrotolerans]ATY31970.1 hypothetical protein CVN68_08285 [Sphingomonas psychrotolerans]